MENKNEKTPEFLKGEMMRKILQDRDCAELIIQTFLQRLDFMVVPNTYDNSDNIYALDGDDKLCRITPRFLDYFEESDIKDIDSGLKLDNDTRFINYLIMFMRDFLQENKSDYYCNVNVMRDKDINQRYKAEMCIINTDYTGVSPFSHLLRDLKCDDADKIRNRTLRKRIKEILAEESGTEGNK